MTKLHQFHKYTAMGNDMIILDPLQISFVLTPKNAKAICDRHFGIGADGICHGPLNGIQPFDMQFYNPDGTQAEKSGNGLRIFARYLCDAKYITGMQFEIAIHGEKSIVRVMDDTFQLIQISMVQATFDSNKIPVTGSSRSIIQATLQLDDGSYPITCVNVGNPHCVLFTDILSADDVKQLGAQIEVHSSFPQRTNVQWVKIVDKHNIRIEIWERGAGYTLASGTSACATACASIINGFCTSPITVDMAGGTALVEVDADWNINLTGTVQSVARGCFSDEFLALLE